MKWWDQMPWSSFFECWVLSQFFTLLVHFHQEALEFFTFCHKGGVICVSEVIDISPSTLDSSFASSSPAFHMMYSAYIHQSMLELGDNIQPWRAPFPIWNQSVVPCLVLTVASWPECRFLRRQVRWSGIPISWRTFHSLLWSTQSKIKLKKLILKFLN